MKIGILWSQKDKNLPNFEEVFVNEMGNNLGNLLYLNAIETIFPNSIRVPWSSDEDYVNKNFDLLIFPAANQLGNHTNLLDLAILWSKYDIPIIPISIGIQSLIEKKPKLNDGTFNWLGILINNAIRFNNKIFTRGDRTKNFINSIFPKAPCVSIGCPSQFIMPQETINKLEDRKNLNIPIVYGSGYLWDRVINIEKELLKCIIISQGCYILNSPLGAYLWAMGENKHPLSQQYGTNFSLAFGNILTEQIKPLTRTFLSIEEWKSHLLTYDNAYSIGFRIHGTIMSLLCGIPSILIPMDERTLELAETLSIPYTLKYDNIIKESQKILLNFSYKYMYETWIKNYQVFMSCINNSLGLEKYFSI